MSIGYNAEWAGAVHQNPMFDSSADVSRMLNAHVRTAGVYSGLVPALTNGNLFRPEDSVPLTARGPNAFSIDDPNHDPMADVFQYQQALTHAVQLRGGQKLGQIALEGDIPPIRKRALVEAFTTELVHPNDGAATWFSQFAFMPADPTPTQAARAMYKAQQPGTQRIHAQEQVYSKAPYQSFRYSTRY